MAAKQKPDENIEFDASIGEVNVKNSGVIKVVLLLPASQMGKLANLLKTKSKGVPVRIVATPDAPILEEQQKGKNGTKKESRKKKSFSRYKND
jgi:hypothetical protein